MKCLTNPYTFILCIGKLDKVILKYIREVKGPKIMKKKNLKKNKVKEFSRFIISSCYLRKCCINKEIDKLKSTTERRGQKQAYVYTYPWYWTKLNQ